MKTKDELKELKNKHRLEAVMVDTGEKFETGPREWRCLTVPGLVVDIVRQAYRIEQPGQTPEEGDVFAWLRRRYRWSFGMAVRYLESRIPDAPRDTQSNDGRKPARPEPAYASFDDREPSDNLQRKALALAGDEIRPFFSSHYSPMEILSHMSKWPTRFLPIVDAQVDECAECGAEFDWTKPGTLCYLAQFHDFGGLEMPAEEQRLFILDNQELTGFICENCKQEKVNFFLAMQYCAKSAWKRKRHESEERKRSNE